MSDGEPEIPSEASATLARLGLADLRPVYQPVVDLRDGRVVGYEALIRGDPASPLSSPAELFAAARAADVVAAFDAACRAAAVRGFELDGAGPFALFLNAAADTLGDAAEVVAPARHTIVIEITEQALVSRPDVLLRALTQFRTQGWGVALQNVGADSRSLALMSLLYPDVIKLDLRRLLQRSPEDVARIVGAVGAESERRQAIVLVEGIDSEEQMAAARAFGAQLGQGFLLGEPGPLPATMPEPGRALRLTSSGGDPGGDSPFLRVTNWKRPARGSRELAESHRGADPAPGGRAGRDRGRARRLSARGPPQPGGGRRAARAGGQARVRRRARRTGRDGRGRHPHRPADGGGHAARDLDRRGTRAGSRRLLRRPPGGRRDLRARHLLRPRPGRGVGAADHGSARAASSAMTFESWLPCQASGELPGSSERSSAPGMRSA